jgi:hypothetical protein
MQRFIAKVERDHKKMYSDFQLQALAHNVVLYPALGGGTECFEVRQSAAPFTNRVEVHGGLMIEQLPFKRSQTAATAAASGRIRLLMNSFEIYKFKSAVIDPKSSFLYKSMVRIAYYKGGSTWKTLLCLRYDFASAKDAHPIFHAQMENGTLDAATQALFSVAGTIVPIQDIQHAVRIPTANMIGATALLKIAADHMSIQALRDLLIEARKVPFFKTWRCDCSTLDNVNSAKKMLALGWYGGQ